MNKKPGISGFIRNALLSRVQWLERALGCSTRDLDKECGYPTTVDIADYEQKFERGDVAARVVTLYPEETWSEDPEIFEVEDPRETPFEKAWKELERERSVYSHLQAIDTVSGIGRFGILLLGLDDGGALNTPVRTVEGGVARKLLYLRALDETVLTVESLNRDIRDPRFGQPEFYKVRFDRAENVDQTLSGEQRVHWSRAIHVADNRRNSIVFGTPRMQRVWDRLLDLKKVSGGSSEMFWKGGFPGLSMETQNADADVEFDVDATREQLDDYMNGLQRYLATSGLTAKSLSVNIADPRPNTEMQLRLIATAIGVPWRIFIGSEVGQLASQQDTRIWNRRLNRRRQHYLTPCLIRPFVDRMIEFGVLPQLGEKSGYQVGWTDLNSPSDQERAIVAEKLSNAIAQYRKNNGDALVPSFSYLTRVMGWSVEEANAVLEDTQGDKLPPMPQTTSAFGGAGRNGSRNGTLNPALNAEGKII